MSVTKYGDGSYRLGPQVALTAERNNSIKTSAKLVRGYLFRQRQKRQIVRLPSPFLIATIPTWPDPPTPVGHTIAHYRMLEKPGGIWL